MSPVEAAAEASVETPRGVTRAYIAEQYELHGRAVFNRCLMLGGGNTQWAKDATQDVFVRFIEQRAVIDPTRNVRGWLCAVAYHVCLDRLRRERTAWRRVSRALQSMLGDVAPATPERLVIAQHELAALAAAIDELPPKQRVVVIMKHLDHLSQREIATALGLSEGYTSKLLDRATRFLGARGWKANP